MPTWFAPLSLFRCQLSLLGSGGTGGGVVPPPCLLPLPSDNLPHHRRPCFCCMFWPVSQNEYSLLPHLPPSPLGPLPVSVQGSSYLSFEEGPSHQHRQVRLDAALPPPRTPARLLFPDSLLCGSGAASAPSLSMPSPSVVFVAHTWPAGQRTHTGVLVSAVLTRQAEKVDHGS